jgi:hypothetical protein
MNTNAVTEQGSAPADVAEFDTYRAEANARDLARLRGESPKTEDSATSKEEVDELDQVADEKEATDEKTAETEDSATSEKDKSETAAASEAANQQGKDSKENGKEKDENANGKREKTAATSESRWAKITRENRELRERLARVEGAQSVRDQRDTKQESQTATDGKTATDKKAEGTPKPTLADKDDKGQPKYKTYEEFQDARDEWLRAEIKRESAETSKQSAQETERQRAEKVVWDEQRKRVDKAREKHADFDAVAFAVPMPEKSPLFGFILDSAHGTDVLYHLGKNPADAERIQGKPVFAADGKTITRFEGGLSPIAQIRELSKIEAKFSTPTPPAKRITSAPPPPTVLNGNGAVGSDEVEQALKEGDQEAYSKAANARDLARRRGK